MPTIIGKGVKGNLSKHIKFWEYIGAHQFVLDTIRNGYFVPFESVPPSMHSKITNML